VQQERNYAFKLIAIQATIVVVLALIFLFISFKDAYSVLLGGLCCVLPSIYFAHKLFRCLGARMAGKAIRAFYFGEIIKLFMIALLSILVFIFITINPLAYFVGFILAQLAFWIAPNVILWHHAKILGSTT
jgi:ATP synthase protein I